MHNMNSVLFDEFPILVDRVLAEKIGLNEAIVIQQLHYWIMQNKRQKKNFYDGRYWTFNSFEKWHKETFYFWSIDTVKRTFKKLEIEGIIITSNYNKRGYDRTKWYSINYEVLNLKCCNYSLVQNALIHSGKMHQCISADCTNALVQNAPTYTRDYTEITKETTNTTDSSEIDTKKELIESKTHLVLTKNMKEEIKYWDKTRLIKSIEIFNRENGKYFKLLKRIYEDNGNFVEKKQEYKKTGFHNFEETFTQYSEEELEKIIMKDQKIKYGD